MRKTILTLVLALVSFASASAQFEKGKKYLGANLNGFGISYSKNSKLAIGLGVDAGYMIKNDMLLMGATNLEFANSTLNRFELGAKFRYYIEQNGIFLSAGTKFVHEDAAYYTNDFVITPEVGYCYFLNGNLTIQPSVYFDISTSDFGDKSRVGLNLALGWFF